MKLCQNNANFRHTATSRSFWILRIKFTVIKEKPFLSGEKKKRSSKQFFPCNFLLFCISLFLHALILLFHALDCRCYRPGSNQSNICDGLTGECNCLPNVTGQFCDKCKVGFEENIYAFIGFLNPL